MTASMMQEQAAHDFPAVGELVTNRHAVASSVPVRVVADEFFADTHLDALAANVPSSRTTITSS